MKKKRNTFDMTGKKFSSLTVLSEADVVRKSTQKHYNCQCECGNKTIVVGSALRSGTIKTCVSCGHTKHGFSRTLEFKIWTNLKYRCNNTHCHDYAVYGGRGVRVCDRWADSFEAFMIDMGPRPSPKHTVDRIDVDGNYEPSNCRWATRKEQSNNRRVSLKVEFNGEAKTVSQWGEVYGVSGNTIWQRLKKGWPTERAITLPSQYNGIKKKERLL